MSDDNPVSKASDDSPPSREEDSPFDGGMSLFDRLNGNGEVDADGDNTESLWETPVSNEAVAAVLRGWADDAGWSSPDFWSNGSATQVVAHPATGRKIGVLAAIVLGGLSAQSWTTASHWLPRLNRSRRKPR
jgi:hypothetical protein